MPKIKNTTIAPRAPFHRLPVIWCVVISAGLVGSGVGVGVMVGTGVAVAVGLSPGDKVAVGVTGVGVLVSIGE